MTSFFSPNSSNEKNKDDNLINSNKIIIFPKENKNMSIYPFNKEKNFQNLNSRKNFILKSEICKNNLEEKDSKINNNNNAIMNYYCSVELNNKNLNENLNENKIPQNNYYNEFYNTRLINNIYNIIKTNNYYSTINYNNINEKNYISSILTIIKDKSGSITMKNKIISDPNFANEILFPKIKNNLNELCLDNFGNFFLQSLLDIITFDNLNIFIDSITNDFFNICISPFGTRVIQKIIDKITFTPMLINKIIYILNKENLGIICKSQYGNHVIQKILSTLYSSEYTFFIYNYIYNNFLDITNDKHGVFIIQKSISVGNKIQREKIYELIYDDLINIIKNEYGNYLIQFILINNYNINIKETFNEILPIILKIEDNIINLCLYKYSANVIEKCFEKADNLIRNHILDSLFNNYSNKIINIYFNKFGIYVLLKASKAENKKYKDKLINIINKNKNEINNIINTNTKEYNKILKIIHNNKDLNDIYKGI